MLPQFKEHCIKTGDDKFLVYFTHTAFPVFKSSIEIDKGRVKKHILNEGNVINLIRRMDRYQNLPYSIYIDAYNNFADDLQKALDSQKEEVHV